MKKLLLISVLLMTIPSLFSMSSDDDSEDVTNRMRIGEAIASGNTNQLKSVLDEDLSMGGGDYHLGIFFEHAPNADIAQMLIDYGADVNGDCIGRSPLHAVEKMPVDVVERLLRQGANPNAVDKTSGITPLYCAVDSVDLEKVRLLLAYGADPCMRAGRWKTTMIELAESKNDAALTAVFDRYLAIRSQLGENGAPNATTLLRNREIYGNSRKRKPKK